MGKNIILSAVAMLFFVFLCGMAEADCPSLPGVMCNFDGTIAQCLRPQGYYVCRDVSTDGWGSAGDCHNWMIGQGCNDDAYACCPSTPPTPPACYQDSDCGSSKWIGSPYCGANNDVYQMITTHACNNPGQSNANCEANTHEAFKQDCLNGCSNGQCITPSGCAYNNPPCGSNYTCTNNQCVLKSGCAYNNPACGADYNCVNNQCVLKTGCQYNNPSCSPGYSCQNNQCVPVCSNQCSSGQKQCSNSTAYQTCVQNASGCWVWSNANSCSAGQTCSSGNCIHPPSIAGGYMSPGNPNSTSIVTIGATIYDAGNDVISVSLSYCAYKSGQSCMSPQTKLMTRISSGTYSSYETQIGPFANGTFVSTSVTAYDLDGKQNTATSFSFLVIDPIALPVCSNQCASGQKQCKNSTAYQTCVQNASGCWVWSNANSCSANQLCSSGNCANIACSKNSDCGNDGWVLGSASCGADGNVHQLWRTQTCSNPGTASSSCSHTDSDRLYNNCTSVNFINYWFECGNDGSYNDFGQWISKPFIGLVKNSTASSCSNAQCQKTITTQITRKIGCAWAIGYCSVDNSQKKGICNNFWSIDHYSYDDNGIIKAEGTDWDTPPIMVLWIIAAPETRIVGLGGAGLLKVVSSMRGEVAILEAAGKDVSLATQLLANAEALLAISDIKAAVKVLEDAFIELNRLRGSPIPSEFYLKFMPMLIPLASSGQTISTNLNIVPQGTNCTPLDSNVKCSIAKTSNNGTLTVNIQPADLQAKNLRVYYPAKPKAGTKTTFKFSIFNAGPANVNNIYWTLDFGEGSKAVSNPISLSAGQQTDVYKEHVYKTAGNKRINLFVDSTNHIIETNDNNNKMNLSITVV